MDEWVRESNISRRERVSRRANIRRAKSNNNNDSDMIVWRASHDNDNSVPWRHGGRTVGRDELSPSATSAL